MKKVTLFLAAFLVAGAVKAQDSVTLDMQLLPNKKYDQVSEQNMKMEMAYGGESRTMNMISTMKGDIKTDAASSGNIPVTMKMNMNMTMKMEGMADQTNEMKMDMYGSVKEGQFVPVFDSINAPDLPSAAKQAAMGAVKEMMTKISYPKKTLKVGETFVQDVPMEIPVGGGTMKMKDVVTYKLNRIEGKKAYFTVSHDINLAGDVAGAGNMQGTGKGTGEMVYDAASKYPVINTGDMDMNLAMQQGGMSVEMKMKMKVNQTTTVSNK